MLRMLLPTLILCFPALSQEVSETRLRDAWSALGKEDRIEIARWFSAECERLDTFQNTLMRFLFGRLERDRYDWPEAPEQPPLYDARRHAPAQPIQRTFLAEDSPAVKRWQKRLAASQPARKLRVAWSYDYAKGSVVRQAPIFDPERIFENGVAGFPPDLDLAQALVEQSLDDGSLSAIHAAFAHAYADRGGHAYPGMTLYDVWASGAQMEMPDVECLGIVHDILGEWKRWVAPVPPTEHEALYDLLGELFLRAYHHRSLREALARTYLQADPALPAALGPHCTRLHALWDRHASDPAALAKVLPGGPEGPDESDWDGFWERLIQSVDGDEEALAAGVGRRATLAGDARRVRATLVRVMREYGALAD